MLLYNAHGIVLASVSKQNQTITRRGTARSPYKPSLTRNSTSSRIIVGQPAVEAKAHTLVGRKDLTVPGYICQPWELLCNGAHVPALILHVAFLPANRESRIALAQGQVCSGFPFSSVEELPWSGQGMIEMVREHGRDRLGPQSVALGRHCCDQGCHDGP
ncbi:uncharacterized protein B0I36DRAFT_141269 [Microdochium trichocladiopsis]|uniref:Uncharacterized protein n=1 Tax=Microdochium trichocladiopsis TaxID=1682393 RepID=A0A9P9BNP2_9PEZI|nr:uncharacterized protein B0I36DRAFT_141269 [Microdochium trichocladiopsis]KAH7027639.1 hypothetical protein B0I36DRAFT_141269 [Microdochium trichocladiopsis]